jgi:predicted enzyme related to lactoylglutathione lyase
MYGRGEKMLGGMYTKTADMPGPPAWTYYVSVDDVDAAKETIEAKGGTILTGPMDVPGGGRILMALDPQGAAFALHQKGAEG